MKLQKQLSRKVGSKEYSKYVITLPPDEIKKLGWKTGEDLELELTKDGIKIVPKKAK
jgi:bifunctional DNA-binding transcriptional regulator/antitoxin component of YhaV-PrlF toxin-antitoxin module